MGLMKLAATREETLRARKKVMKMVSNTLEMQHAIVLSERLDHYQANDVDSFFKNEVVSSQMISRIRLLDSIVAKLKKPVYVATATKYLRNYGFNLEDMKIIEHLTSELDDTADKKTYAQKKTGITKLFQNYIYGCDELEEESQAVYMTRVIC